MSLGAAGAGSGIQEGVADVEIEIELDSER